MHPDSEDDEVTVPRNGKFREEERKSDFWIEKAKRFVTEQVQRQPNTNRAKNVIIFVGDGMSHPTIAAARVAMGDEGVQLAFEKLPYTASSITYCIDEQVGGE